MLELPEDVGLIVVSDDPDDGKSIGPSGRLAVDRKLAWAVVWSGAWSQLVWDHLVKKALRLKGPTLIVLTQEAHHDDWLRSVGDQCPVLSLSPTGEPWFPD